MGSEAKWWSKLQEERAKDDINSRLNLIRGGVLPEADYSLLTSKTLSLLHEVEITIISGECPFGGIDIWAKEIALKLGLNYKGYPPEVKQWEDKIEHKGKESYEIGIDPTSIQKRVVLKGFKSRNLNMVEDGDVFYVIEPTMTEQEFVLARESGKINAVEQRHWFKEYTELDTSKYYIRHSGGWWVGDMVEKLFHNKKVIRVMIG